MSQMEFGLMPADLLFSKLFLQCVEFVESPSFRGKEFIWVDLYIKK